MKRAGALLGVVVMVAVAFIVRSTWAGDDEPAGGAGGDDAADIVCASDLMAACTATSLEVVSADAGATADRLLAADDADALGADAWVVTRAWAELVIAERARLGAPPLFEVAGSPIASTSMVLAIWDDRDAELAGSCPEVDWRCLADRDGSPLAAGDRVRAAGPPVDSAAGLPVAAAQMASIVGTSDFAANDFDGAVLSLADRLARHQTEAPLRAMRSRGPGQLTAAGALAVDADNLSSNFGTIVPRSDDAIRVDVVLVVARGTSAAEDTRTAVTEAFRSRGWTDPAATPDDGLPDGSVLAAVRTIWNDAR